MAPDPKQVPDAEPPASAAELRTLLDTLPLATLVKDGDGRVLYVNAAASAGYGFAPEDMIGGLERDFTPPGNDIADVRAKDREVMESGRSLTLPGFAFRTREGRPMVLHMTRDRIRFGDQHALLVTAMDVTDRSMTARERRRLERRMAEAQRLESLGLLAGGIAHDFNNLLIGVLANTQLAQRELGSGSKASTYLERVQVAANRLADLSRQMLAYSGRGHVSIEPVDLAPLVDETLTLLRASIPTQIRFVTELPTSLPAVDGDRAQLS